MFGESVHDENSVSRLFAADRRIIPKLARLNRLDPIAQSRRCVSGASLELEAYPERFFLIYV